MGKAFKTAAGATAGVVYPLAADLVEHGDGVMAPKQFMYVEQPGGPSAPKIVIECDHTGPRLELRVTAVHAFSQDPRREVRPADLNNLRIDDAIEDAARYCFSLPDAVETTDGDPTVLTAAQERQQRQRRVIRGLRQRGRRRLGPELLDDVAHIYRENRHTGAPTKAVRERLGIPSSTASLYVRRAREEGLDMGDTPEQETD